MAMMNHTKNSMCTDCVPVPCQTNFLLFTSNLSVSKYYSFVGQRLITKCKCASATCKLPMSCTICTRCVMLMIASSNFAFVTLCHWHTMPLTKMCFHGNWRCIDAFRANWIESIMLVLDSWYDTMRNIRINLVCVMHTHTIVRLSPYISFHVCFEFPFDIIVQSSWPKAIKSIRKLKITDCKLI